MAIKKSRKPTGKTILNKNKSQKSKVNNQRQTMSYISNSEVLRDRRMTQIAKELGRISNNFNKIIENCAAAVTELKKENNIVV